MDWCFRSGAMLFTSFSCSARATGAASRVIAAADGCPVRARKRGARRVFVDMLK